MWQWSDKLKLGKSSAFVKKDLRPLPLHRFSLAHREPSPINLLEPRFLVLGGYLTDQDAINCRMRGRAVALPVRQVAVLLHASFKRNATRHLMKRLLDFIKEQSDKLKKGQQMPGHTEVLESLLGKYKDTQARHSQGGMTASLLNIGAIVLTRSPEIIQQALATVPVKTVNDWVRNNLGQTVASRRKLALQ